MQATSLFWRNWVKKRELLFADMLQNGERITGEWLAQAHGLIYKIEVEPIVFYHSHQIINVYYLKNLEQKQSNTDYNFLANYTKASR